MLLVQPQINLSEKQSQAWHYLNDSTTTEILYGGGAGGGKTLLGCIWHIYRRITYPGTRGLIGRAKLSSLEESTLVTLFKVCADMGYEAGVDFNYNSQKHIITWSNGSKTILKDLFLYPSDPDFIALGSTEYTDAFIDEINEVTEKAADMVASRIRWMLKEYNLVPKLLGTCNPSPGWVKNKFIVDDLRQPVKLKSHQKFIHALLSDNPDASFKDLYKVQLERMASDYDKQRLIYGDWETERAIKNPFAHQYNAERHESTDAVFDPTKQLVISIDFNINPFAVTFHHVWRDTRGVHHHQFDEMSIENGSIPAMVERVNESRYAPYLQSAILTGDAMGKVRQIGERDHASLYKQLLKGWRMSDTQLRVPPNPTHENSRADVNYFLLHHPDYKINPASCPQTARDMKVVQCDAFGQIIKRDRKDINQRADFLDAGVRYPINTFWKHAIERHQKTGTW